MKNLLLYWTYLVLAIAMEIAGTTLMKVSNGFTKIIPSLLMFVFYIGSLSFLTMALKKIEIGIAYAVWSGVGTASIVIIGIMLFKEGISLIKIVSIILVIVGVIGLNISGSH